MFSKIIKEIVRGKMFFCSFVLLYIAIIWWALLSGQSIAVKAALVMTCLLGVILIIVGIATSIEAIQSHSWLTARAKLTKHDLKISINPNGTSHRNRKTYKPVVSYQFKVGDRNYIGSNYDFSDFSGSKISAKRKIESLRLQLDEEGYIRIYYKPSDPEINVIYPGIHLIHGVRLVLGLMFMLVPLLTLLGIIQW